MKLIDAEWKGFASYADVANVKFFEGLTGIVATYAEDDRKSMGAGKSTIVMTLLYALFNKGSFKSVSEVINDTYGEKDHVYVKFRFAKYGNIYTIERGILNGAAYLDLYENDVAVGENKIASRNEEILKIVGWDYDMFTASIFFEQDKLSKLVDTDGAKRREYIEKIINTRDWTLIQEQPNRKGKKLLEEIALKQKEFINIQEKITKTKEELMSYTNLDEQIESKQIEKESLQIVVAKCTKDIQEIKDLRVSLNHKKDIYKSHETALSSLMNSVSNLTIDLEELKNKQNEITESTDCDTKALAKLKKDIVLNKSNLNEIMQSTEKLIGDKSKLEKEIAVYEHEISSLTQSQSAYTKGEGTCENCEQEISSTYAKKKIEEKTLLIQEATNKKEEKLLAVSSLIAQIEENKKIKIAYLTSVVSKTDKDIAQLETMLRGYDTQYSNNIKEIDKNTKLLESYNNELVKCTENKSAFLQELNSSLNTSITSMEDFLKIIQEAEKNDIADTEATINSASMKIKNLDNIINTLHTQKGKKEELSKAALSYEEEKTNISSDIITMENEVKLQNMVLKGFKEIPSNLLAKNIQKIETYANEYIKKFIPYMEVCVEEDLEKANRPIEIYYKFRDKERSYRMLSGGQKTVANLGLRLAFSKIISEKTKSVSEVIVLDEPFGYLDAYSRDLIKNVLADLQKYYKQIIIISHIDNVTDFPNIINVRMENNKSYII